MGGPLEMDILIHSRLDAKIVLPKQKDEPVAEKQPRWGFGTSQRPDTSNTHGGTPGPGAYIMSTAVGGGPKYSMQPRRQGLRPQPSPGPGAHGGHYSTFG